MVNIISYNINGTSVEKLRNLITEFDTNEVHFICIQEVKTLCSPKLLGYTLWEKLNYAQHGVAIYSRSDIAIKKVTYIDHNNIFIVPDDIDSPMIFCSYIPYSKIKSWRFEIASTVDEIRKVKKNKPIILCGDYNLKENSIEFSEFKFLLIEFNILWVPNDGVASCRSSTIPDHFFCRNLSSRTSTLKSLPKSDHRPILGSFETCKNLPVSKPIPFVSLINTISNDKLDTIWADLDLPSISTKSISPDEFFLSVELKLRSIIIDLNLIQSPSNIQSQIKKNLIKRVEKALIFKGTASAKFKKIVAALDGGSCSFSFADIKHAISLAEKLPINPNLAKNSYRIKSSKPLHFSSIEIFEIISGLNSSKSNGLSLMSAKLLKRIPMNFIQILSLWFTRISVSGYPQYFRINKAVGLAKSDGDIRPICIMNCFSKVYDVLISRRIEPYLTAALPNCQTAYLASRRGCEEHIFVLQTLALKYSDLVLVVTDYSKAFNTLPNSVIWEGLISCKVPINLAEACYDSVIRFNIRNFESSDSATFSRGVRQGGCTSGILFTACMAGLSAEINKIQLKKPCTVGSQVITHLIFADDLHIIARCFEDSWNITRVTLDWSKNHGLVLNTKKCKILTGHLTENLWFSSTLKTRFLGVDLIYDNSGIKFCRQDKNMFYAHKISPILKKTNDVTILRNLLNSFNSGPFCTHICHIDEICDSRDLNDLISKFSSKDSHWKKIIGEFVGIRDHHMLSINRITSVFSLQSSRFFFVYLKYCHNFKRYVESLDNNNLCKTCYEAGYRNQQAITKASKFFESLPSRKSQICELNQCWLHCPRKIRRLVAPYIIGVKNNSFLEYRSEIFRFCQEKKFQELKKFLSWIKIAQELNKVKF